LPWGELALKIHIKGLAPKGNGGVMAKVVVADKLDSESVLELKMRFGTVVEMPKSLEKEVADAQVLIVRSRTPVTKELLGKAPKLKIVARSGVGLDSIDLDECRRRGIRVVNTPDAPTVSVAELVVGMIISLLREIPRADAEMKRKKWIKDQLRGKELFGKTVGIVGFGRIGEAVAERLSAFGCRLLVFSPRFKPTPEIAGAALDELLKKSDIVTLHAPLTKETAGMIGKREIALMKDGAYLVNAARGALVDEDALYDALKSGKIAGAALDVYPSEPYSGKLCGLGNVVLLPHIGANTEEALARTGKQLLEELEKAGKEAGL